MQIKDKSMEQRVGSISINRPFIFDKKFNSHLNLYYRFLGEVSFFSDFSFINVFMHNVKIFYNAFYILDYNIILNFLYYKSLGIHQNINCKKWISNDYFCLKNLNNKKYDDLCFNFFVYKNFYKKNNQILTKKKVSINLDVSNNEILKNEESACDLYYQNKSLFQSFYLNKWTDVSLDTDFKIFKCFSELKILELLSSNLCSNFFSFKFNNIIFKDIYFLTQTFFNIKMYVIETVKSFICKYFKIKSDLLCSENANLPKVLDFCKPFLRLQRSNTLKSKVLKKNVRLHKKTKKDIFFKFDYRLRELKSKGVRYSFFFSRSKFLKKQKVFNTAMCVLFFKRYKTLIVKSLNTLNLVNILLRIVFSKKVKGFTKYVLKYNILLYRYKLKKLISFFSKNFYMFKYLYNLKILNYNLKFLNYNFYMFKLLNRLKVLKFALLKIQKTPFKFDIQNFKGAILLNFLDFIFNKQIAYTKIFKSFKTKNQLQCFWFLYFNQIRKDRNFWIDYFTKIKKILKERISNTCKLIKINDLSDFSKYSIYFDARAYYQRHLSMFTYYSNFSFIKFKENQKLFLLYNSFNKFDDLKFFKKFHKQRKYWFKLFSLKNNWKRMHNLENFKGFNAFNFLESYKLENIEGSKSIALPTQVLRRKSRMFLNCKTKGVSKARQIFLHETKTSQLNLDQYQFKVYFKYFIFENINICSSIDSYFELKFFLDLLVSVNFNYLKFSYFKKLLKNHRINKDNTMLLFKIIFVFIKKGLLFKSWNQNQIN